MDFTQAVIFLAAVIIVVAAGAFLGAALRGRDRIAQHSNLQANKAELYAEVIGALDMIREADDRRKQWFIHRYYQLLVYAPDKVVTALNRYLDAITTAPAGSAQDHLMELRGEAIDQMRNDIQGALGARSRLSAPELYKIEVRAPEDETQPEPKAKSQEATKE